MRADIKEITLPFFIILLIGFLILALIYVSKYKLDDDGTIRKKDVILQSGFDYIIIEITQSERRSGIRRSQIENVDDIVDLVRKTEIDSKRIILVSRERGIITFDIPERNP